MYRLALRLAVFLLVSAPLLASAQPTATFEKEPGRNVRLEVGQTQLIHLSEGVVRVSVADPNVADVQVVNPRQVLITAKSVGYTHLILWGSKEEPLVMAVSATRNLDQLRAQFEELFPDEKIRVSAVGDLIVLSGTVSDLRLPARAAEVASLHTERLANLIKVTGDQQVQLDVRFAEVSRTGLRNSGVNFLWRDNARGHVAGAAPPGATPGAYLRNDLQVPGTGSASGPPVVGAPSEANSFNLFFSTGLSDFPFSAILSIMSQEGLAKILAEPTLVALSGQSADFHAGGEVPILLSSQLGQVSVAFKKFGVRLNFVPTVLSERTMSLKLRIEVSEPDPSSGVTLSGFTIPGFRTRNSETTIRLKDGQSFGVAGLLSDDVRASVSKVPGLGDLPILGALFSSTAYQREETELLMVVSAHLVKPLKPGETPLLPGEDTYNDPSDFELFLLGSISGDQKDEYEEGRKSAAFRRSATKDASADTPPASAAPGETSKPAGGGPPTEPEPPDLQVGDTNYEDIRGPVGPIGFVRG